MLDLFVFGFAAFDLLRASLHVVLHDQHFLVDVDSGDVALTYHFFIRQDHVQTVNIALCNM